MLVQEHNVGSHRRAVPSIMDATDVSAYFQLGEAFISIVEQTFR